MKEQSPKSRLFNQMRSAASQAIARMTFVGYTAWMCCVALAVIFMLWLWGRGLSAICIGAAASSVALFCILILRTVPALERAFLLRRNENPCEILPDEKKIAGKVFFVALGFVLCLNLFITMLAFDKSGNYRLVESLEMFWRNMNIDASHYMDIAKGWYRNTSDDLRLNIVFFPLYPVLIRVLTFIGLPTVLSAILISGAFTALSCMLLYKLSRLENDSETSLRTVKYLLLFPASFFLIAPMSESVFLFFTLNTFYLLRKNAWDMAAICAFLAALTRSTGVVLVVPIAIEAIAQMREEHAQGRPLRFDKPLAVLAPLAALLVYLFVNQTVYGDPFAFIRIQREHWSQQITFFWNTPVYQIEYLVGWLKSFDIRGGLGLMGVSLLTFFASLAFLCSGAKKMRADYMGFSIVYFAMTMGAQWLLSAPRYTLCLFPLFMILAQKAKNSILDTLFTVVSSVCSGCLFYMFLVGYYVF